MFWRMLMTTVAAFALAVPAVAQEQPKPSLDTEQEATQPLEQAQEPEPAETPAEQEVTEEKEATPPPDMTFIQVQDEAQFLANEEVIGKEVVNIMDEEVGTIADLVMDQDQKLVGVVLGQRFPRHRRKMGCGAGGGDRLPDRRAAGPPAGGRHRGAAKERAGLHHESGRRGGGGGRTGAGGHAATAEIPSPATTNQ